MKLRHTLYCAAILMACGVTHAQPQIVPTCPGATTPGTAVNTGFTLTGVNPQNITNINWSVINAPPGFTLNGNKNPTVIVNGQAPANAGTYPVTVVVQFQSNFGSVTVVGPATCQLAVQPAYFPVQIIGACPAAAFSPGTSIFIPLTAQGGSGLYAWRIDSSSGLKLSATTGTAVTVQGTAGFASTTFTVTVTDNGSDAPTSATFTCTINVSLPGLMISGVCPTGPIGVGSTVSIPLSGAGGSGTFLWQINAGNSGLTLSSTSGASTTIQGTAPAAGQYTISVTLSDPLGRGTPATFTCSITVVAPLNVTGVCPTQTTLTGTAVTLPLSASGGNGNYTWTVTGPLTPSSTTGNSITLSGTPTTAGSFDITATVHDSAGTPAATFKCTIHVVAPLTIAGPPCPITTLQGKSVAISLSGMGGTGNYGWSINGPSFISLSATTGTTVSLTGVSSSAGTFPFTVTLSDDAKTPLTAPYNCALQVSPILTLQSMPLPDGVVGQTYPPTKLNATGGTPPLTFSVSQRNLPPGLQLDPSSGTISGTPTQAATFAFTATVTDSGIGDAKQTASATFQIVVEPQLVNTTSCPLPTGRELQNYNAPLTATGGTGQYTFALAPNTFLPPGLVFTQNAITGTPQGPSTNTLSLQITSGGQTVTVSCGLTILGRLPVVTVNGFFTSSGSPLVTSSVTLDAPVQQDVNGKATLSFTPDVPNSVIKDNAQVQFCGGNAGDPLCGAATKDANGLLRIVPFTIPAGSTEPVDLPPILQSNVAGTIQLALTGVTMGGQAITVAPLQFTIARTPPQILSNPQASFSGNTLQITMTVSSDTCELTTAVAVFTPAAGAELEGSGTSPLTVSTDLSGLFKSFTPLAMDATHPLGGCAVVLNLPYTVSGDESAVARVDLIIQNSVGAAPTVSLGLQP